MKDAAAGESLSWQKRFSQWECPTSCTKDKRHWDIPILGKSSKYEWPRAHFRSDFKVESDLEDDPDGAEAPNSRSPSWPELLSESVTCRVQMTSASEVVIPTTANGSCPGKDTSPRWGIVFSPLTTHFTKLVQGHRPKGDIFVINNLHWIFQPSICQSTLIFSFPAILRHITAFLSEWIEVLEVNCISSSGIRLPWEAFQPLFPCCSCPSCSFQL